MKWSELDAKLRERVIKSAPKDFDQGGIKTNLGVGAVPDQKPQSHAVPALEPKPKVQPRRPRRLVISLIGFRSRCLDYDNFVAGLKPIRDAIASDLGVDDADPRLEWEYSQVKTTGPNGILVKIAPL